MFEKQLSIEQLKKIGTEISYDEKYIKEALQYSKIKTYDVFLSHSFRDANIVWGLTKLLENLNLTVYVDWINDSKLDRKNPSIATAEYLKKRMRSSHSLLSVYSTSMSESKWVPWEVGYFESVNDKIAILPITQRESTESEFKGQEYLGLYYYGLYKPSTNFQSETIIIKENEQKYATIQEWLSGRSPYIHN